MNKKKNVFQINKIDKLESQVKISLTEIRVI